MPLPPGHRLHPIRNPARRGFGICPGVERSTLGSTFAFGLNRRGVHVASASAMTMSHSDRHAKRRLTADREPDEAHRDRSR